MKRPLAIIGFTYLAILCVAAQFDIGVCIVFSVLCMACGVVLFFGFGPFRRRAALVTVLCTAGAAFAFYAATWHLAYWPMAALAGKTAQVKGTVTDIPVTSGQNAYYLVKADAVSVNGHIDTHSVTLRVKTQEADIVPFSRVTFSAALSLPSTGETDGFNSQQYYRSKGVYLFATPTDTIQVSAPTGFHPYAAAIHLRQFLSARLQERVGGVWGALSAGILIGDVSNLPTWVKRDFTTTGISHILAVSGTQTSLIMQVLLLLSARLRLPRRPSALLTAAVIVVFMAVTGFSPSVNRAGVMSLLYLGGLMLGREADALNSLGISVLVLCLLNPFAAMDTGLLLSFSATLGLVLISGHCVRWMDNRLVKLPARAGRLLRPPGLVLCETVGATLLTLPVILVTFRQLSLVTFFSNVFEVPISLLATLLAAAASLLPGNWLFLWLVKPVALLLRLCCALMIGYAHLLASLPFATVYTDYAFVYPVLLLALAVGLLVWKMWKRGADLRAAALCVAFALSVGLASHAVAA
ncbi:ComEC/Rec2 family competence protein [Ethanoligenens sp.]|uniref:ComEC/Rec2 family competence protein n=1 Tax=Ethanoligenens sp. TaxID=2099655 RepID=UPI0039E8459F